LINTGYYVDADNFDKFAHIADDGNFAENIGSRVLSSNNSTSGPALAAQLTNVTFILKKFGNLVDFQVPTFSGTSVGSSPGGSITFTNTSFAFMAAEDLPRRTLYLPVKMYNGTGSNPMGTTVIGGTCIVNSTTGNLTFQLDAGSTFNTAQTIGVYAIDLQWDSKL